VDAARAAGEAAAEAGGATEQQKAAYNEQQALVLQQQQNEILQHHQKQAFTQLDGESLAKQTMEATARAQGGAYVPQADHRAKRWADTTAEELEEVELTGTAEHMEQFYMEGSAEASASERGVSSPDKAAGGQTLTSAELLAELDEDRKQNAAK